MTEPIKPADISAVTAKRRIVKAFEDRWNLYDLDGEEALDESFLDEMAMDIGIILDEVFGKIRHEALVVMQALHVTAQESSFIDVGGIYQQRSGSYERASTDPTHPAPAQPATFDVLKASRGENPWGTLCDYSAREGNYQEDE